MDHGDCGDRFPFGFAGEHVGTAHAHQHGDYGAGYEHQHHQSDHEQRLARRRRRKLRRRCDFGCVMFGFRNLGLI